LSPAATSNKAAGIWPEISAAEFIARQGKLQRQINALVKGDKDRREDIVRLGALFDGKLNELAKRFDTFDAALQLMQDDDHTKAAIAKLGFVALTDTERKTLSEDISDRLFEKEKEKREAEKVDRQEHRSRFWDSRWTRASAIAVITYGAYQMILGGTPLIAGIRHILH
jgi:hypothetical protein